MKIYGSDIANAISSMERAAQVLRSDPRKSNEIITLYIDLECNSARLKTALGLIDVEIKDGQ